MDGFFFLLDAVWLGRGQPSDLLLRIAHSNPLASLGRGRRSPRYTASHGDRLGHRQRRRSVLMVGFLQFRGLRKRPAAVRPGLLFVYRVDLNRRGEDSDRMFPSPGNGGRDGENHFSMQCAVALAGLLITPCSAAARSIAVTPESSAWVSSPKLRRALGDTEIGGGLQLLQAHAEAGLRPTDPSSAASPLAVTTPALDSEDAASPEQVTGTTVGARTVDQNRGARVRNDGRSDSTTKGNSARRQ
jgi:hypothetical protein